MSDLANEVVQAFSRSAAPPSQLLEAEEPYMEKYFLGRKWHECSPRELRSFGESLSFFTPESFRYYLPAFMIAHLTDAKASDHIGQGLCIHLLSTPSDALNLQLAGLTQTQRHVLVKFVREVGPVLLGDMAEVEAIARKVEHAL